MPLLQGSSEKTVSENIAELIKTGHSREQSAAIAYKEAGKERGKDDAFDKAVDAELDKYDTRVHQLSDGTWAVSTLDAAIAFDRASVRRNDSDGHLFVGSSIVSAAQVNPYYGREIPNASQLGLDPERKYMLLRDPAALEAAVPGLHGKPLLIKHRSQTRNNYDPDVTVGSVMNPKWVSPNVMAELSVVHPDGVRAIETGQQTDLSAGYRYKAVMEPGTYNGQPYDGRMTDIQFNHVALVPSGRVEGAMVADANPDEALWGFIEAEIVSAARCGYPSGLLAAHSAVARSS